MLFGIFLLFGSGVSLTLYPASLLYCYHESLSQPLSCTFFILFWLMPGMGYLGWGEHGTVGTGYINPWLTEELLSGNETTH